MNTSGMGTLLIIVYKGYGAVLFKGEVQLKLFPETKTSVQNNSKVWHELSKHADILHRHVYM